MIIVIVQCGDCNTTVTYSCTRSIQLVGCNIGNSALPDMYA